MSNLINQITDAIEAEIHEAWTESDADFNRGMEYAVSIVKAMGIRTNGDLISRQDAIDILDDFEADIELGERDSYKRYREKLLSLPSAPSAEAEQVTGKLNKRDDSLLKSDSDECKEQKSKLDLISREEVLRMIIVAGECEPDLGYTHLHSVIESLPSAEPERKKGEWIRNDNGTYSCSICKSWIPEEQHHYARYCLYCGADMRGEEE